MPSAKGRSGGRPLPKTPRSGEAAASTTAGGRVLAVSIGNSSILCGVFSDGRLLRQFRVPSSGAAFGRAWGLAAVKGAGRAAVCSVVPRLTARIRRRLSRQLHLRPSLLTAGANHGLVIGYRRPGELGTDRLAAAMGARRLYPKRNVIVVDCGTATTVTALSRKGRLAGGAILPGLRLWPDLLARRTARLPAVALRRPRAALGRSTREGIRSGVFFGHLGAVRELVRRIRGEAFGRSRALVVGTGGNAGLFAREDVFDLIEPGLILYGLDYFASRP